MPEEAAALPSVAALVARVRKCQEDLDAAKSDLHTEVTRINTELAQAAAVLGRPAPVHIGPRRPRGARMDMVRPLYDAGLTPKQAAEQLGMRVDNVRCAFTAIENQLKLEGKPLRRPPAPESPPAPLNPKLPPAAASAPPETPRSTLPPPAPLPPPSVKERSKHPPIYVTVPGPKEPLPQTERRDRIASAATKMADPAPLPKPHASPDVPASIDEITAEIKRQQAGMRGKKARLLTTMADGHRHVVTVDGTGEGISDFGKGQHFHVVQDLIVKPCPGPNIHRHDVTAAPAPPEGA